MSRPFADLERILGAVSEAGADFVIVGGYAMVLQGANVLTSDIDFAMARTRENARKLALALAPLNPRPVGWPEGVPYIWDEETVARTTTLVLDSDAGSVDLLGECAGVGDYAALKERASWKEVFGRIVRVASVDDLIAMKKAAGRPKDLLHLMELEALKKLIDDGAERSEDDHPQPENVLN